VPLLDPRTGETLRGLAARRERSQRRSDGRIVKHAQHLCDEPLLHGVLLARQGEAGSAAGLPGQTILAIGPTRIWALVGGGRHPDRAEEVVEEWPRARVTLGEVRRRSVELRLPGGERTRMRPSVLSLEAQAVLAMPPSEPAYLADTDGLERVEPDGRATWVTWDALRQVTLVRATSQGWGTVLFTGVHGDLRVPFDAMREAIWERVRRLPGANAPLVDSAIASAGPRDRLVWWQGMDTDPDVGV
jgi:YD repeat-containing protein